MMVKPASYREICEKHFKNGKSTDEIYKGLACMASKRTIQYWRTSYNKHGRIIINKSTGRRRVASNILNVNKVKRYAKTLSKREISKKIGISETTIRRILKENG